jgi:ribosomal protein L29
MAILRQKDIVKMTDKERETKLSELKMELVKAGVTANKQNAKTKEIKRAISRLLTYKNANTSTKEALKK